MTPSYKREESQEAAEVVACRCLPQKTTIWDITLALPTLTFLHDFPWYHQGLEPSVWNEKLMSKGGRIEGGKWGGWGGGAW